MRGDLDAAAAFQSAKFPVLIGSPLRRGKVPAGLAALFSDPRRSGCELEDDFFPVFAKFLENISVSFSIFA